MILRLLTPAVVLLLTAGPAVAADPPTVDELIKQLGSKDAYERVVACEELALLGPKAEAAIPGLTKSLTDPDWTTNRSSALDYDGVRSVVFTLVRVGPKSIPGLVSFAELQPRRSHLVMHALRQFGPESENALPWLITQVGVNSPHNVMAADTISVMGEKAKPAIETLISTYKSTHDPILQDALTRALMVAGPKGQTFVDEIVFPNLVKSIPQKPLRSQEVSDLLTLCNNNAAELYPVIAERLGPDRYLDPWAEQFRLITVTPEARKAIASLLANPDPIVKSGAISLLSYFHPKAVRTFATALIAILKDEQMPVKVRTSAAEMLGFALQGETGDIVVEVSELLVQIFSSPAFLVSPDLVRVSHSASRLGATAVPNLIRGLRARDPVARGLAAEALGRIGPRARSALPTLKAMDEVYGAGPWVHVHYALARIGGDKQAAAELARVVAEGKDSSRAHALIELLETGPLIDAHYELFIDILKKKNAPESQRSSAIAALVHISSRSSAVAERLANVLPFDEIESYAGYQDLSGIKLVLKAKFPKVLERIESGKDVEAMLASFEIAALGSDAKAAVPALAKALSGEEKNTASYILSSLTDIGPDAKEAVPAVRKKLSEERPTRKIDALKCLAAIGPGAKEALPEIEKLTTSTDPDIRLWATCAVARITGDYAKHKKMWVRLFELAIIDPAQSRFDVLNYSTEAMNIFPYLSSKVPELLPLAKKILSLNKPGIRPVVIRGLRQSGPNASAATPILLEILDDPMSNRNEIKATLWAISALGPAAKSALPRLKEWTDHSDPWYAYEAAEAIKAIEGKK
jgi:HEAT repeat protein